MIDDAQVFNDKLREWEDYYNYHRPHGGLGGQTPYERLNQKRRPRRKRSSSVAHPRRRRGAMTRSGFVSKLDRLSGESPAWPRPGSFS